MLYVNNKFLNLDSKVSDEFDAIRKDYNQKISSLKLRFGDYVTLKTRTQPVRNSSGLLEPWKVVTAPLKQTVAGNNGSEEWLYTKSIPAIKDNYVVPDTLQEMIQYGELKISLDDDPDKAYFFIYKHEYVKSGKLYIVDLKKDEEDKAEARAKEADLNSLIYGSQSALNLDKEKLRVVAKRWGVGNVEKMTPAQIKNALYDVVREGEYLKKTNSDRRGIYEFVEDCRIGNEVMIGSVIQEAIDQQLLYYNTETRQWCMDYKDGGKHPVLLAVSAYDSPLAREVLINTLAIDPVTFNTLTKALGREEDKHVVKGMSIDDIENIDDYAILKEQAKLLNITIHGMKKEDLKASILQAMSGKE